MEIRSLQTKGVFAIRCKVNNESILCDMLGLRGNQASIASLLDADSGERFLVEIPPGKGIYWDIQLKRVE